MNFTKTHFDRRPLRSPYQFVIPTQFVAFDRLLG
jgi:hypothetical protein